MVNDNAWCVWSVNDKLLATKCTPLSLFFSHDACEWKRLCCLPSIRACNGWAKRRKQRRRRRLWDGDLSMIDRCRSKLKLAADQSVHGWRKVLGTRSVYIAARNHWPCVVDELSRFRALYTSNLPCAQSKDALFFFFAPKVGYLLCFSMPA